MCFVLFIVNPFIYNCSHILDSCIKPQYTKVDWNLLCFIHFKNYFFNIYQLYLINMFLSYFCYLFFDSRMCAMYSAMCDPVFLYRLFSVWYCTLPPHLLFLLKAGQGVSNVSQNPCGQLEQFNNGWSAKVKTWEEIVWVRVRDIFSSPLSWQKFCSIYLSHNTFIDLSVKTLHQTTEALSLLNLN